jgi:hypothetical protein
MTSVRSDIAVSGTPLRGREKSKKAWPRVPLGRSTTSCLGRPTHNNCRFRYSFGRRFARHLSPALPARVEPAGVEDCGTRSSDYFKSLAQVVRERLWAVGGARRGQIRHGKAMS